MTLRTSATAVQSGGTSTHFSVPTFAQATDIGLVAVCADSTAGTVTLTAGSGTITTLKAATVVGGMTVALFSAVGVTPGATLTITFGSATTSTAVGTWWPSTGVVDAVGTLATRTTSGTTITAASVTTTAASEDVVRIFWDVTNAASPTLAGADNTPAGGPVTVTSPGGTGRTIAVQAWTKAAVGATAATTATFSSSSTASAGIEVAIGAPPPQIVATPDTVNSPPRMLLEFNGGGAAATTVSVYRIDAAGNQTGVRNAEPAAVAGGSWVGYDYEAPFGQPVTYFATADTGAADTTDSPATLAVTEPWLLHPGKPDLSVPISLASSGDRTRDVSQGVFRPLGRATAIVITAGKRQASSFDLVVKTSALSDEAALLALLDDASPLLLQIAYPNIARSTYEWVAVGTVTEANPLTPYYGSQFEQWTLPCVVVDRPAGALQAQWTWNNTVTGYATWNAVVAAFATWNDLIEDNP